MKAVLLAAGKGERLGAISASCPKPMIVLDGKPLIERNVALCRDHGFDQLCINLHHLPEVISDHLGNGSRFGVSIRYAVEPELLGTAGGVKQFSDFLAGAPFLVVYADNHSDYDLTALLDHHREKGADMTIALFHKEDVRLSGVALLDPDGRITGFVEKPTTEPPPSHWVNAGLYILSTAMLAEIPDGPCDFGKDVIPRMIADGRKVFGKVYSSTVIAVDTPELLSKVIPPESQSPLSH